ncbi:MAG: methyltransferase domain-containing protein [Proteobacteria bacterium]|nr:methyltransferase domain-containing protein [Pseudomonadota bacterium]
MRLDNKSGKNQTRREDNSISKQGLYGRLASIDILMDVFVKRIQLDLSFEKHSKDLTPRDKPFCFALVNFVLRKTVALDSVIEHFMEKPYEEDSVERQILRIGLAQLFFMNSVEEFACIHTSVEIAKIKAPRSAKVVNGVLRNAQRTGFDFLEENYELLNELPKWLSEILNKDYPQKSASLKSAMLVQGNVHVRLRDKAAKNFLEKNARPIKYLPGAWALKDDIDVNHIPKLDEFSVYVQDISSQLVGHILSQKVEKDGNLENKTQILDLCAAPGGKAIHLLDMLPYAKVTACDNNHKRLETLKSNLAIACEDDQDRIDIVLNDALKPEFEKESFDYILLDAPCSGLGISRKHSDVIHIKQEDDLKKIFKLQSEILPQGFSLLKKGGTMMYSTCSLLKDEGERQIDKFLDSNKDAKLVDISEIFDEVGKVSHQGYFRTFPTEEMDGFFMALIVKK